MSVQFGRWHFQGQPPAPDYVEKVSTVLAPYGPDSNEAYSMGGVKILYRAFHTTKESHRETQPYISPSRAVITWDGRLDNRAELIGDLRNSLTLASTDVEIVAAAHERWGADCFAKLVGDWALSIWNPNNCSLILAIDPIGTRHLYYSLDSNQITWSTILDPLVLFAGKSFAINEEYIAGWFSMFPAAHLTPYIGICAVPPSSSAYIRPRKQTVSKYWDFDPEKKIRYRSDTEYEEHFRSAFAKAVQDRLRSDRPVLAELSGGMDSSSIVCMADVLIGRGAAETSRLDTISWYDDSYDHVEPDWNERPYFTKVEEKRGRPGYHINVRELREREVCSQGCLSCDFDSHYFVATPTYGELHAEFFKQYAAYMLSQGHRVTLSGIGGGEVTGGSLPTPRPELQDLIARAQFFTLVRQLNAWAVKMRKSRLSLLWEATRGFFPFALGDAPREICQAPWLHPGFIRRNLAALCGYPSRTKLFGPLPSFQDNLATLQALRMLFADWNLRQEQLREVRFPYLDRDLLEFLYAVPREQIVRIGQRRSLMKRALINIVPDELLNRKRRPFVPPQPTKDPSAELPVLVDIGQHTTNSFIGIVDVNRFLEALQRARFAGEVPTSILNRTLMLESWLRHLANQGVLTNSDSTKRRGTSLPRDARRLDASTQPKSLAG